MILIKTCADRWVGYKQRNAFVGESTFKWKYSFAINGLLWKSNLSSTLDGRAHAFLMVNMYTVIYMRIYKNAIECQRIISAKSLNARHFPRFSVAVQRFACSQHREFACVFVNRFRRVKFIDFSFFAHHHFVLTTCSLFLSLSCCRTIHLSIRFLAAFFVLAFIRHLSNITISTFSLLTTCLRQ